MWEVQLVPALVHTAFVISLVSIAALIGVWAALSPRHRLLRLAGFCVLPAAFVLASAPWLSIWFLMAMLPITAVLIVGPFVARAPFGRTWPGLPKVRFGFRDLFFAIFLIAFALFASILLGKQEYVLPRLRLWSPWVIEPLSLWLPVSGATALVVGTGSRLKRIAWMIAGCTLGSAAWYCAIWAFERGVFRWWEASGGWFDLRLAWSLGGLIPCVVALIVAAHLALWRDPRWGAARAGKGHSRAHRRVGMVVRLAATAVLVAPGCIAYYELAKPVPIPHSELPTPNGYDRLVAIGKELARRRSNAKRRDELVREARRALKLPSLVTVNYTSQTLFELLTALKVLHLVLDADAQGRAAAGDDDAALGLGLDALEVGIRMERGGVLLDMVPAVTVQRRAVNRLLGAGLKPSASECREGLRRVRSLEQRLEPLEQMLEREHAYARHSIGWYGRWIEAVESWSRTDHSRRLAVELRNTTHAWLRILICDLAVQAYQADHQRLPDALDELVSEYLEAVPEGPFDGEQIKFSKEPTQYSIWTSDGGGFMRGPPSPKVVRPIP